MAGEKTEKATHHKRLEARRKGNVFQSKDLISAASILICFSFLSMYGTNIFTTLTGRMTFFLQEGFYTHSVTGDGVLKLFTEALITFVVTVGPVLLVAMLLGLILSVAQTRFIFTPNIITPKFDRLNPISGIKKMFSLRALAELFKSILKVVLIIVVLYYDITERLETLPVLLGADLYASVVWLTDAIIGVGFKGGAVMLAIGIADYAYQWWEYERSLRMSKQEIKEEYKQMEGDPQTKGRVRSIQRKMAQQRMMAAVPTADVIIRNPQHYAVALKYDANEHAAPIVIAKGMDLVALKIIEIGQKHDIEMREDPPLARAIYSAVELGHPIPEQFYGAVADILAYIYEARRKIGKV